MRCWTCSFDTLLAESCPDTSTNVTIVLSYIRAMCVCIGLPGTVPSTDWFLNICKVFILYFEKNWYDAVLCSFLMTYNLCNSNNDVTCTNIWWCHRYNLLKIAVVWKWCTPLEGEPSTPLGYHSSFRIHLSLARKCWINANTNTNWCGQISRCSSHCV